MLEICVPWLEVTGYWLRTPEDGHNVARNMLSYWLINKS